MPETAVHIATATGHRLTFRPALEGDDQVEMIVPDEFCQRGAAADTTEVTIPAELIRRLVTRILEDSPIEPEPESFPDLELLRRLAEGTGGRRTGALKRAGYLEWKVTPRGVEALNEASLGMRPESKLVAYARDELQRAGLLGDGADYGASLGETILEVVRTFCSYGHSGGSAAVAIGALERLLHWKPLTALDASPGDWLDISPMMDAPMWQSRRSPSCFSLDGGRTWYDQDAVDPEDPLPIARYAVPVLFDDDREVETISRADGDGEPAVTVQFKGYGPISVTLAQLRGAAP